MTTRSRGAVPFPVAGLAAALAPWFSGMAAAAYLFDPAAVVVFAPGGRALSAISGADGVLLASGAGFATGRSDRAGFVPRFDVRGAWFVWPSPSRGCVPSDGFAR